jgi:hypothetical protein
LKVETESWQRFAAAIATALVARPGEIGDV